ncbi:MAG TPA: hypothetical protein VLL94_11480 [Nitrospiraceae bacterium]|nr:hypothetical protein [Nitrospiraceae bacterium]
MTLKPVEVLLDAQADAGGGVHTIDFNKGDIIIKQSGMYLIIAGPQLGKVRGATPRWIDLWLRVNNIDMPNSNIRAVIIDPQEKTVGIMNSVLPLNRGDTLNIVMQRRPSRKAWDLRRLRRTVNLPFRVLSSPSSN